MTKSVVVYTQPGCLFCEKLKAYLHDRGVAFTERDISVDDAAMSALEARGFFATPVTMIDGDAVVGFNRLKLEALLDG